MAETIAALLPPGYTRMTGDLGFDVTKTGKPGRWTINQNDPYAVWELTVSYVRDGSEETAGNRFDQIYSFFLVTGGAFAFKVEDPFDNSDDALGGEGWIEQLDGVWRATKRYSFGGLVYTHPITRLQEGIVLTGGAEGLSIDLETGIVAGCQAAGRWAGKFYRPMIFASGKMRYETDPSGLVRAFDVPLQENLEL